MRKKSISFLSLFFFVTLLLTGSQSYGGDFENFLNSLKQVAGQGSSISTDEMVSGLKEALEVGTDKAVAVLEKPGGYSLNPQVKIPLPETFQKIKGVLQTVGYGPQLEAFDKSMNMAAEAAAPKAKAIFWDSIKKMSISDAGKILKGDDTAATKYLKDVVLLTSPSRINRSIKAVNDQEQRVYKYLDTVRKRIIGNEGKTLENETRKLFDNWRPIREEVIEFVRRGEIESAAVITVGKGADHVAQLEAKMLGLTNYAKKKASDFMRETELVHSRVNLTLIVFLLLSILTSFLVALFTIKRIGSSEKELQESESKYKQVFETNTAIKLMIDPEDGTIVEANDAACNFYGYSKRQMATMKIADINALPPEKTRLEMQKAKNEERLYFSFSHRLASGEVRDVEVYSGPVNLGEKTLMVS